jgi:Na+/H+-translocating membrane pyrophosphatase
LREGTADADSDTCISISTQSAIHEMILPGLYAILSPLSVGYIIGPNALVGMLTGSIISGMMLAVQMSNAGGAWDNAKKYIEIEDARGGKGTDVHKACIVGDTVGDPFKDTSGPSLNILIKLMSIIALTIAPSIAGAEEWEYWFWGLIPFSALIICNYVVYRMYWRKETGNDSAPSTGRGKTNMSQVV